ncbi:unnamed protein product [Phytophthora fragariaefolia]|uniref:Unnamed protein product n=1 Tax=Phytophthora fragariaefolia TaxID=1490495 RepID=A0A9W7DCP7_9STRA|nr:unnamed protein product [Phytophthora fragariaefolia]
MRSFDVLALLMLLFAACSTTVLADFNKRNDPGYPNAITTSSKRLLLSTGPASNIVTEERGFTLTPTWLTRFRIWKLKRDATWDLNKTPKQLAKEKKEADKLLVKEANEYAGWMGARFSPEYIYKKLGLLKLGDAAEKSPNFRRYVAYKQLWAEKANDVAAPSWIKVWWTRYKLNRLKSKAAAEMKKADKGLEKDLREYQRWIKAKYTPENIYKWLGLETLGSKATSSKNYRHYEAYLKVWYERYPTGVAT